MDSSRIQNLNQTVQEDTNTILGSARNYDFLNLTSQKDISQSSIAEEIIDNPQQSILIMKPKAIQTIPVRKTVREMRRERMNKEIEERKSMILMEKDTYQEA
jgi:hypothetical protein